MIQNTNSRKMNKSNKILAIYAESWEFACKLADLLTPWRFRGQSNAKWQLASTMERISSLHNDRMFLGTTERVFIYELQRRAHHYLSSPPKDNALLEWLAMLQHYGCPTRLVDFTHSFYIAAFFALEEAFSDCAVWAVHYSKLNKVADKTLKRDTSILSLYDNNLENLKTIESCIGQDEGKNLVLDVEPERMNERQSIQRGLFLFPFNIQSTFMHNLLKTFEITKKECKSSLSVPIASSKVRSHNIDQACVIKMILPTTCHETAIHDLRDMNITSATLFPGLDGFARSLRIRLRPAIDEEWHQKWSAFQEKGMNKNMGKH